jgi:hypothetical protein
MRSLFPGIDPYLEHPIFWSSFHTRLMVAIADVLAPDLRPRYYVDVETRTYQDFEGEEAEEELLVGRQFYRLTLYSPCMRTWNRRQEVKR